MRTRIWATGMAAAAIVVAMPLTASAVGVSLDWTAAGGSTSFSDTANWSPAQAPDDDELNFIAGTAAHNDLVGLTARATLFDAPGFLLSGNPIDFVGGIAVASDAIINMDSTWSADQAVTTAAGTTLELRGWHTVLSGRVTFSGAGIVNVTGRLDGNGGAGNATMAGTGTLILSGVGGAIGGGLVIESGETRVTGHLGGTDFVVDGGTLSGGSTDPAFGIVRDITATSGAVSPGVGAGDISILNGWNTFVAAPAARLVVDVSGASSDALVIYQGVDLGGAQLELRVGTAPVTGTSFTIVSSRASTVTGSFTNASGTPIPAGEFVAAGHRWEIAYNASDVVLSYLGAAPTGGGGQLADTGAEVGTTALLAGMLGVFGLMLVLLTRRRRTEA